MEIQNSAKHITIILFIWFVIRGIPLCMESRRPKVIECGRPKDMHLGL